MHEQLPCRERAVAGREERVQRAHERRPGGQIVGFEGSEHGRAVSLDFRFGHVGEQTVHAQVGKHHEVSVALAPPTDCQRSACLPERDVKAERVRGGSADSNADHAHRHPSSRLGKEGRSCLAQLGSAGVTGGDERSDLTAALPGDGIRAEARSGCLGQPMPKLGLLAGPGQRGERPTADRLDLGEQHRTRRAEIPGKRGGTFHEHAPIGHVAGHELLEANGLKSSVGLGDRASLNLTKGRDGRRVLDGLELFGAESRRSALHEDGAIAVSADLDRLDHHVGVQFHIRRRSPLQGTGGVDDPDRSRDQLCQGFGDLSQAAAGQYDRGESIMNGRRSLKLYGLGSQDF